MKQTLKVSLPIFIILFLSGCLYPKERMVQKIPEDSYIKQVQEAVNAYKSEHEGLLPIKTKESMTDIYIKYLIDFNKLVPQYLTEIPANAYEAGGIFQYVIINPESNPLVKVFDMQIADKIREINIRLSTLKYPPFNEVIHGNVFSLDFKKIGYDEEPVIRSPFSGQNLPFVITSDGEVFVDYSIDIYNKLKEKEIEELSDEYDLRSILVEDSIFVPAYSMPYTLDEFGAPIFIGKNS